MFRRPRRVPECLDDRGGLEDPPLMVYSRRYEVVDGGGSRLACHVGDLSSYRKAEVLVDNASKRESERESERERKRQA